MVMPVTSPQQNGLPPLRKHTHGYMVFVTSKNPFWGKKKEWTMLASSWGYPYEIRGFAINKAKNYSQHHNGHGKRYQSDEFESCVVNLQTGKTEWTSWDNKPTT